jgi:hypothetical protein
VSGTAETGNEVRSQFHAERDDDGVARQLCVTHTYAFLVGLNLSDLTEDYFDAFSSEVLDGPLNLIRSPFVDREPEQGRLEDMVLFTFYENDAVVRIQEATEAGRGDYAADASAEDEYRLIRSHGWGCL